MKQEISQKFRKQTVEREGGMQSVNKDLTSTLLSWLRTSYSQSAFVYLSIQFVSIDSFCFTVESYQHAPEINLCYSFFSGTDGIWSAGSRIPRRYSVADRLRGSRLLFGQQRHSCARPRRSVPIAVGGLYIFAVGDALATAAGAAHIWDAVGLLQSGTRSPGWHVSKVMCK